MGATFRVVSYLTKKNSEITATTTNKVQHWEALCLKSLWVPADRRRTFRPAPKIRRVRPSESWLGLMRVRAQNMPPFFDHPMVDPKTKANGSVGPGQAPDAVSGPWRGWGDPRQAWNVVTWRRGGTPSRRSGRLGFSLWTRCLRI